MTDPTRSSNASVSHVTPVRILSAIAALLLLFVIFAPQPRSNISARYSSYAAGAGGIEALYEVLARVGFSVSRNEKPLAAPPDTSSAYVLITPAQPLTSFEEMRLLEAVRRGAILVFTWDNETLTDSLGFDASSPNDQFYSLRHTVVAGGNPSESDTPPDPSTVFQTSVPINVTVTSKSPSGNQAFLWLESLTSGQARGSAMPDSIRQPTLVLGHNFGRGYAIAVAPAEILMNQALRQARPAIAIVRAIQFANATLNQHPRSNRVVFDEYHHGFGTHADMVAAVQHALTATPAGRMALEIIGASLVLLLAFGVRPMAPLSTAPISRRSPLEHVGALAHAYLQVDARALGANRLVRGLRRRHPLGLPRSLPDAEYLSALRRRIPSVSVDVDRISATLAPDSPDSSDHFATTGAAVANIERTFRE